MNILFLHAGALGDCVLTMHVARALQHAGHRVTLAARSPIAAWAARRKIIEQFIWLERLDWLFRPNVDPGSESYGSMREMFDRVVSFLGGPEEAIAGRVDEIFGDARAIHIDSKQAEDTVRDGIHITEQWARQIRSQGLDFNYAASAPASLRLRCEAPSAGDREPAGNGRASNERKGGVIIIHPGSGGRAKCCPLEPLEEFMRGLLALGRSARWMIGPDEVERDGPAFQRRLEATAPVIFEESVEAAADLVSRAGAFIGHDAGMTHVAALAGVNTVALFGPTDPRVWCPLGPAVRTFAFPNGSDMAPWTKSILNTVLHHEGHQGHQG